MIKKLGVIAICMVLFTNVSAQQKGRPYLIRIIAFYNLENIFDTINEPSKNDELSPIMELKTHKSAVYIDRIDRMSFVLSEIGKDISKTSPAIIGVAEVENRTVLEDLVRSKHLASKGYGIIHYESPDMRGIDVALLYRESLFTPIHHQVFNPNIFIDNHRIATRDQLLVSGYLDGELIHIIVNHWPSRRGGAEASAPLREKAAYQNSKIIATLKSQEEDPKVIIMGDFNDDPIDDSFKKVLRTKEDPKTLLKGELYNPYEALYRKGYNTLGHRDQLNLFDQIILSQPFVKNDLEYADFQLYRAKIFNPKYLITPQGKYKGYPFRSFSNGVYVKGYSDHFPVYISLIRRLSP